MDRVDLSKFLIHWISGESFEEAFDILYEIISSEYIHGNSNNIKGGFCCICFTETPPQLFNFLGRKYKPFGIMYKKEYIYLLGGRPVIYQSDQEYWELSEQNRWRHVRFELDSDSFIDFTWEREWRLQQNALLLEPNEIDVVVPDEEWADALINRFENDENYRYQMECMGYGENNAIWPQNFPFNIKLLNDL
ncbi:TPA: hypothetical protein JBJ29_13280 [Legionella pneumophila]|nr:hypothetical protein [Legionella pneumophila]